MKCFSVPPSAPPQEFYQTVRDKCFDKCITKPSTSLSSSEQQCLARCCDRYAEVRGPGPAGTGRACCWLALCASAVSFAVGGYHSCAGKEARRCVSEMRPLGVQLVLGG